MPEALNPFLNDMIELSRNTDEADEILVEHAGLTSTREKIEYLCREFGVGYGLCRSEDGDAADEISEYNDYVAMLAAIIDLKWR